MTARLDRAMLIIDGSEGEGGGQMLRTSLALSLVTGQAFRIERIRAARGKPGLLRQHLTAVQAAAAISSARVTGAELGSQTLSFEPGAVRGGDYEFAVGTAGSAMLVLQTILPPLLRAPRVSQCSFEGGTHNPGAPPFDFVAETFAPLLRRMGAVLTLGLERHGFYPAGGGRFTARIEPCAALSPLTLLDRGDVRIDARASVSALPENIARREIAVVRERLGLERTAGRTESITTSIGPGNVLLIFMESANVCEIVTGFGAKGVTAEQVAARASGEAQQYLDANVPVGAHLADQLLIPMAMAGAGSFRTLEPTPHTRTNAQVIQRFLDVPIELSPSDDGRWTVVVGGR